MLAARLVNSPAITYLRIIPSPFTTDERLPRNARFSATKFLLVNSPTKTSRRITPRFARRWNMQQYALSFAVALVAPRPLTQVPPKFPDKGNFGGAEED